MALVLNFRREPIDGGDFDIYHEYVMQLARRGGEGALSCELYNNAGALYLSKGFFGLNNGTNRGTVECTTEGEIDKSLLTDNLWATIEASVSGAAVTISITSIVGANDESIIPATVKAAYDYSKQAYHLTATKRLLGVVFIRTGNVLGRIVNCESGKLGFKGITTIETYDMAGALSITYIATRQYAIGTWNMNVSAGGSATKTVTKPFGITTGFIRSIKVIILIDATNYGNPIEYYRNLADPNLLSGGIAGHALNSLYLECRTGGRFDAADHNDGAMNR